ncbi:MAG: hypothetical protein M0Z79_07875 [Nitrospiraceae bacterium]|nr:hypothetical protein [Nitrospiraceae bacterium]
MKLSGYSFFIAAMVLVIAPAYFSRSSAEEKWQGVDKTVVAKFAQEHGREAMESVINTDQGDLLLFVFLIAGAAGGFVAGYYWRMLTERSHRDSD